MLFFIPGTGLGDTIAHIWLIIGASIMSLIIISSPYERQKAMFILNQGAHFTASSSNRDELLQKAR